MDFALITNTKRPALIGYALFNFIVTVFGIPLLSIIRPTYHFHLFDYLFLVLHSCFFFFATLFTFELISFTHRNYLSILPSDELAVLKKYWLFLFIISTFIFLFGFGKVAYHDWKRYLSAPILHETTPTDDPQYGSLFSFGPWGWTMFLLFFVTAEILINSVICILIVCYSVLKGNASSLATEEEWRSWMNLYLVFLIWTIIFTLPYSQSNGIEMMIFYGLVLFSPVIAYIIGSFIIGKFRKNYQEIKSIEEMHRSISQPLSVIRKNRIFRDIVMLFSSLTLVLLIDRYLKTTNHFLNNSILLFSGFLILFAILANDFIALENPLGETLELVSDSKVVPSILTNEELKKILNLKMSQIFLLDYIHAHGSVEMSELKRVYPNGYGQFRSTIQTLTKNGYIIRKPNIFKMNSVLIESSEQGVQILMKFHDFVRSINHAETE
ncbi:MAG: hypothetical protein D6732_07055 [Methanobacteriota archaeon]|nr:MAG: hypothetical protein D6732_07055 [Euryarchaeota archaeon]